MQASPLDTGQICRGSHGAAVGKGNRMRNQQWALLSSACLALAGLIGLRAGQTADGVAETIPTLRAWLQAQTNLQTWTAEVTQIRSFKTLAQPLTTSGRVWFVAPGRFRWEMGQPPSTIAVRQPDQLLVIYPKLRRAERYLWGEDRAGGPWKDSLVLLEAGFPRDEKEFEQRFQLLELKVTEGHGLLTLQPKTPGARRMMPRISIEFNATNYTLRATELHFADGSRMRNEFRNTQHNVSLSEDLFEPKLSADYQIVEPLSTARRRSAP